MLSIVVKDLNSSSETASYQYWTGDNIRISLLDRYSIHKVLEVQADGDELTEIFGQIQGLPSTNRAVVSWFGDDAKFIVANLRLETPRFGKYAPRKST